MHYSNLKGCKRRLKRCINKILKESLGSQIVTSSMKQTANEDKEINKLFNIFIPLYLVQSDEFAVVHLR